VVGIIIITINKYFYYYFIISLLLVYFFGLLFARTLFGNLCDVGHGQLERVVVGVLGPRVFGQLLRRRAVSRVRPLVMVISRERERVMTLFCTPSAEARSG
jgi:hypothetical protein